MIPRAAGCLLIAAIAAGDLPAFASPAEMEARIGPVLRASALAAMGPAAETASAGRFSVTADPGRTLDPGLAGRLAAVLVSFDGAYRRMWSVAGTDGPATGSGGVEVYVLADRRALARALSDVGTARPPFEAGGAYFPAARALVVAQESRLERVLVSSLVHEAAHLLNHEIFRGAGLSPWLNEGLAQYCQYSLIDPGGEVRLGAIDPGTALRVPEGGAEIVYQFVPKRSLGYLLGQFRRDPGLSLGPLLDIRDQEPFYMRDAQLHYAQSWTLVHLLAEGRIRKIGPLRPYLLRHAVEDSSGRGGRDALLGALGIPLEDLDFAWYRHVKKLW